MIIVNTFTGARYYLYWDGLKREYHVCNLDTGYVMIWSSEDLQTAFSFGHYEKVEL